MPCARQESSMIVITSADWLCVNGNVNMLCTGNYIYLSTEGGVGIFVRVLEISEEIMRVAAVELAMVVPV